MLRTVAVTASCALFFVGHSYAQTPEALHLIVDSGECPARRTLYAQVQYAEICGHNYLNTMTAWDSVQCQMKTDRINAAINRYNSFVRKCASRDTSNEESPRSVIVMPRPGSTSQSTASEWDNAIAEMKQRVEREAQENEREKDLQAHKQKAIAALEEIESAAAQRVREREEFDRDQEQHMRNQEKVRKQIEADTMRKTQAMRLKRQQQQTINSLLNFTQSLFGVLQQKSNQPQHSGGSRQPRGEAIQEGQ